MAHSLCSNFTARRDNQRLRGCGGGSTPTPPPPTLSAPDSGAVYVFTPDAAGVWSQQAYVKASNTDAEDNFGHYPLQ